MARIAQPKELAELKGADKKNPQRYIKETPKNEMGLGEPPIHMMEESRKMWKEIEAFALPGVLTASDRFLMEILSNLMSEYRKGPTYFEAYKLSNMIGVFARLGLSPADRQKLGVTKKSKDENEFDNF